MRMHDDASELRRNSQATYDEIEQPRADSHYDDVTDALTFNVSGGVSLA